MAPTGTAPVEAHGDGMVDRGEVVFLGVVAGAGLVDPALEVDAEPVDHVAGPAAALALELQRLLGGEDAAVTRVLDMEQEVALLAEQAEAVAHLPADLHGAGVLRGGALERQGGEKPGEQQGACGKGTKGNRDHGPRLQRQS